MSQQQFPAFRFTGQLCRLDSCAVVILIRHLRQIMGKGCLMDNQISPLRQRQIPRARSGIPQNGHDTPSFGLMDHLGSPDYHSALRSHIFAFLQLTV
ncbi:hypothetical protein D3C74_443300 [compost metagenome]